MSAEDHRMLAHDLNNLLAVIINTAAFLKDEVQGDEARQDVEEISKAARRAAELVREQLGPGAGRAEPDWPDPEPPAASQGTVLIVDDEPGVLQLSRRVLEDAGYAVLTASTLGEAGELGAQQRVDLLLTDLTLPDGSGTELAEQLTGAQPAARVLYMSGDLAAQAELPLIVKPFGVDELLGRVGQALA
jgi:CheY-like chemotaxis protein